MKAQSAIEFLSVISLGLILITVGAFFGYDYILTYADQVNSMNAKSTVDNLVSGANLVFSQGVGSQIRVYVNMPNQIFPGKTYISRQTINLNLGEDQGDVVGFLPANVEYSLLPTLDGQRVIFVEMLPDDKIGFKVNESVAYVDVKLYNDTDYVYETENFNVSGRIYYTLNFNDFDGNLVSTNYTVDIYWPNGSSANHLESESMTGSTSGYIDAPSGPSNAFWVFSTGIPEQKSISNKAVYLV